MIERMRILGYICSEVPAINASIVARKFANDFNRHMNELRRAGSFT